MSLTEQLRPLESPYEYDENIGRAHEDALSLENAYRDLDDEVRANKRDYHESRATLARMAGGAIREIYDGGRVTDIIESNRGPAEAKGEEYNYFSEDIVNRVEGATAEAKRRNHALAGTYFKIAESSLDNLNY